MAVPGNARRGAAMYALLGALVGAFASFGGAYIVADQQKDLDEKASKREAYGTYVGDAERYRRQLITLQDAAATGSQLAYDRERAALLEGSADLYASYAMVVTLGDGAVDGAANELNRVLFATNEPASVTDYPAGEAGSAISGGSDALVAFVTAAQTDLEDE